MVLRCKKCPKNNNICSSKKTTNLWNVNCEENNDKQKESKWNVRNNIQNIVHNWEQQHQTRGNWVEQISERHKVLWWNCSIRTKAPWDYERQTERTSSERSGLNWLAKWLWWQVVLKKEKLQCEKYYGALITHKLTQVRSPHNPHVSSSSNSTLLF